MNLNEIWTSFAERMAEIELFQRAAKASAKNELSLIAQYGESLKDRPELKELSASLHNMTFYDARTGTVRFYNHKALSVDERYLHVLLHKNKQYQWLLSEAYEEFEDFLENMYAYYGSINNEFWPLEDYGNITLSELGEKDYAWHVMQARKKKKIPRSILNRFRKQFPMLKNFETTNKITVNLSLAIALIEELRHKIVHEGGKVSSKDDFIKNTTERAGLYNNGKVSQKHLDFVNQFFGKNEFENLITLIEITILTKTPIDMFISRFGELTNWLMAYAALIYDCISSSTRKESA